MTLRSALAHPAALGLALLLMVWGFWSSPLYDIDEGAFTEATREMIASGNYTSIYLNGRPRQDKPILIYWAQAASVHLFGLNEFALRLPSVLAALAWVLALVRFGRRHLDRETGLIAGLLLALSLYVGLIARAAVADALLNLFLALALFDIYNDFRQPARATRLRVFVWMGLGFLTKGPVAVLFPFLVSGIFYAGQGRWRDWLGKVLDWRGLLLFLAIVLPWHVAVYLDSGWAFFKGFYLHHNLDRYGGAMEGHSGGVFYYVLVAPLVLMPFATWFLGLLRRLPRMRDEPLDRFAWTWFLVVLVVFSFSGTKLPHYLLYGMTGIFLLMARYRDDPRRAPLHFLPGVVLLTLFALLPWLFDYLARHTERLYEKTLFIEGVQRFSGLELGVLLGLLVAALLAGVLRAPLWSRLLLLGFLQSAAVAFVVLPGVMGALQDGPRAAALYARAHGRPLVFYRVHQPSVSLYAGQVIRHDTHPRPGEWVYLRVDKLEDFMKRPSPYRKRLVFRQGIACLVAVEAPPGRGGG